MKNIDILSFWLGSSMLICASFCTYGQQKITAYKVFGGVVYELDDSVTISPRQVSMLVKKIQKLTGNSNSLEAKTPLRACWDLRVGCLLQFL